MNDEKHCLLCVFNPLNVVQTLYYGFSFGTIEYLSVGGEGVNYQDFSVKYKLYSTSRQHILSPLETGSFTHYLKSSTQMSNLALRYMISLEI